MARKGRERLEKRLREQDKQKKAAAKRERRAQKNAEPEEGEEEVVVETGPSEEELFEQFRLLNEAHAEDRISTEDFEARKALIMEQLGIE